MSKKFLTRGAVAAAVGAGLALGVPAMAQAHVGVTPDALAPGSSALVTLSFGHGCEGSPTTELQVTMPDGLTSVSPSFDSNWDIDIERDADDGLVDVVTFTAHTPIPSELRGSVSMQVAVGPETSGSLVFPVVQRCETGANDWTDVAADGQDPHELDSPAPVITVDASAGTAGDGHGSEAGHGSDAGHGGDAADGDAADGDAAGDAGGSGSGSGAQSDSAEADAGTGSDALPIALGAGGLVAGVAALVVSLLAYRRRA